MTAACEGLLMTVSVNTNRVSLEHVMASVLSVFLFQETVQTKRALRRRLQRFQADLVCAVCIKHLFNLV